MPYEYTLCLLFYSREIILSPYLSALPVSLEIKIPKCANILARGGRKVDTCLHALLMARKRNVKDKKHAFWWAPR